MRSPTDGLAPARADDCSFCGVFGVLPVLYVLVRRLFVNGTPSARIPTSRFTGVENYRRLVFDRQFLTSVWLTLRFAFFAVAKRDRARLLPRPACS